MLTFFPSQALIRRELLTTLRSPRSFVLAGVLTLLCCAAVLSSWPSQGQLILGGSAVSAMLVNMLGVALLVGCALFIPGIAGSAIVSEKERDSFDLLHTSLIPPWGIVFGKLINVLGFFILLTVAMLPVLGVVFFLVGVGWGELLYRLLTVYLAALSCASAGLLCSAWFRRGLVAIAASYVGMLVVFGTPVVLLLVTLHYFPDVFWGFDRLLRDVIELPGHLLVDLFPNLSNDYRNAEFLLLTLVHVVSPLAPFIEESSLYLTPARCVAAALYQLLFAAFCFYLTVRTLRRPPVPLNLEANRPIDDVAILEARRKRFPYYLIDPLRRKKDIEDGRNPLFVKEARWGMLGRMTALVRIFYAVLVLDMLGATLCIIIFLSSEMTESIAWAMVALITVTCMFAPALLASTFTKEREQGNLDMLRMTLLTPAEIVRGKLGGAVLVLAPLMGSALFVALLIGAFVGFAWQEPRLVFAIVLGVITLFVSAGLVLSVSMLCSLRSGKTSTALVTSYAGTLVLFVGLFVAAYVYWRATTFPTLDVARYRISSWSVLWDNWPSTNQYGGFGAEVVTALSPLTAFVMLAIHGTLFFWLLSMIFHAILGMTMLFNCLRFFTRRSMRDS